MHTEWKEKMENVILHTFMYNVMSDGCKMS